MNSSYPTGVYPNPISDPTICSGTKQTLKYGNSPVYAWGNPFTNQPVSSKQLLSKKLSVGENQLTQSKAESNHVEKKTPSSSNQIPTVLNEYDSLYSTVMSDSPAEVASQVLQSLSGRSVEERQLFISKFNSDFCEDLFEIVRKLFPQDEKKLSYLFYNEQRINVMSLHIALEGMIGTVDSALAEVLFLSSNLQLHQYPSIYREMFPGRELLDDIKSTTSDNMRDLCLSLLEGNREENSLNSSTECDCIELIQTPKEHRVSKIIDIFSKRNKDYLKLFIEEFKYDNKRIREFVKNEMPRIFLDLFKPTLVSLVSILENKQKFFARQLKELLNFINNTSGVGPTVDLNRNVQTIIRIFLLEYPILREIEQEYNSLSDQTLQSSIRKNIKLDVQFKILCLKILSSLNPSV